MLDNQSRNIMQKERMHLAQVRKAFAAVVDKCASGQQIGIEFFGACVDYIRASMDRLHAQDQRIHNILKPLVAPGDRPGAETLSNLDTRLARSRRALDDLCRARDTYRAKGSAGWTDFKAAIDTFMDVYHNVLLKGQHSTLDMQKRVFSDSDWGKVAGVSESALVSEASLYALVRKHAPSGADPAAFKAGPPVV